MIGTGGRPVSASRAADLPRRGRPVHHRHLHVHQDQVPVARRPGRDRLDSPLLTTTGSRPAWPSRVFSTSWFTALSSAARIRSGGRSICVRRLELGRRGRAVSSGLCVAHPFASGNSTVNRLPLPSISLCAVILAAHQPGTARGRSPARGRCRRSSRVVDASAWTNLSNSCSSLVGRYAGAGVGHRQSRKRARPIGRYPPAPNRCSVNFSGVGDQVGPADLPNADAVPAIGSVGRAAPSPGPVRSPSSSPAAQRSRGRPSPQRPQVEVGFLQLELAGLDFRQIENVVEDRQQRVSSQDSLITFSRSA